VFKGEKDNWVIRELLDDLDKANDLYFDDVIQIHMPSRSNGRVALVGDAGYAPTLMTGQGTSFAVVGGYILAGKLKNAGGDHRVAFPAYQTTLKSYVDRNQELIQSPEFQLVLDSWEEIHWRDKRVSEILAAAAMSRQRSGKTTVQLVSSW